MELTTQGSALTRHPRHLHSLGEAVPTLMTAQSPLFVLSFSCQAITKVDPVLKYFSIQCPGHH